MEKDLKERVFETIINCEISLYSCTYSPDKAVVTISNLVTLLKDTTKYKVRKALKELIEDDLIYYTSQGRPAVESIGEYRELVVEARPPVNGYALTEKGFKSSEFKKSYDDWSKSMAEWANGTS